MSPSIGYYVELARIERARAIEILDSERRDRLALAKRHLRAALMHVANAKQERNGNA